MERFVSRRSTARILIGALILIEACVSTAATVTAENVLARAKQERAALLDTLKELVAIESGSSDIEGLDEYAASSRRA
jgi:glutamate carboxypeptidase